MTALSYWGLNKEVFVKTALVKYKESDGLVAGYDILRYAEKGALKCQQYSVDELQDWKWLGLGYVILGLAKENKLEYNEG
jgi:hypothetical protein